MERDWKDFKSLHSNIAGARTAYETAMESLVRAMHPNDDTQQVEVRQGDGGIDIYVGKIGIAPVKVYQCKFFLEAFAEVQRAQIRKSFKTAKESTEYDMHEWILCLPITLDLEQNKWWAKWKETAAKGYRGKLKIGLMNGSELIMLLKQHSLYNTVFQMKEALMTEETHRNVSKLAKALLPTEVNGTSPKPGAAYNDILFNNYTLKNEKYYYKRAADASFKEGLSSGNIWLFGNSGCGKTAMAYRNLLQSGINFVSCDCGPLTISSVDDIMQEVIESIGVKYGVEITDMEPNHVKRICKLLSRCEHADSVILIDEISFPNIEVQRAFADTIAKLVHFYNKKNNGQLKFVVSTIPDPLTILEGKSKASEHFLYIDANNWGVDIRPFLETLLKHLNLSFSNQTIIQIEDGARKNPRLLKNILRKIYRAKPQDENEIQKIIAEAHCEVI
jgi:hypothetical protein